MKKTHIFLILGLSVSGLVMGFAARRITQSDGPAVAEVAVVKSQSRGVPNISESPDLNQDKSAPIPIPLPASTDTVEILLALDDATLYPRLAAWLLGAGEGDIAAYWNGYRPNPNRKTYIADLVFINWTRLNPMGAIAAVAGTPDDYFPWWAWTAHDPEAALAAAIATAPQLLGRVARGIGGFHPEWLQENIEQIPEQNRAKAFAALKELDDTQQPLESLKFMKEHAMGFDEGIFKSLARKDPWEAMEWLKQNPSLNANHYYSGNRPVELLMKTMISEYPKDLPHLLAQTPSGEMKRQMEAAVFENLLATNPDAAIAQARATESKAIAAEQFAKIGLSVVKTDPDLAFEMARALLEKNGGNSSSVEVEYPGGSMSWGSSDNGSGSLLGALLTKDPARLMQMALENTTESSNSFGVSQVAHRWANEDLTAYTNWVNEQTDPAVRNKTIGPIVSELTELGQYSEAIEWARSSQKPGGGELYSVFYQWGANDPDGAQSWIDSSDLTAEDKGKFQTLIKDSTRNHDE